MPPPATSDPAIARAPSAGAAAHYVRLARPHHWVKGGFVLIGPAYGLAVIEIPALLAIVGAFLAFGFASSTCYVLNDVLDAESDRAHPRKRLRPVAAGLVSPAGARALAAVLFLCSLGSIGLVALAGPVGPAAARAPVPAAVFLGGIVLLYVANTLLYSAVLKHWAIADVISLALGFVLRVLGGCAAVMVAPSTWLLNCTLFLAMFLAFGKRLGERRTMGSAAAASSIRGVQTAYSDELLRMAVVVTAVATLITYAGYVQAKEAAFSYGFNLLWLTMLPATYALLRSILLVEAGRYDDPTELASRDRPFQIATLVFVGLTVVLLALVPALGGAAGPAPAPGAAPGLASSLASSLAPGQAPAPGLALGAPG